MSEKSILSLVRLPARLNVEQTGEVLGFLSHEIGVLSGASLLKPLGKPAANGHKFFCTREVLELSQDRQWLDKATRTITKHWQDKNQKAVRKQEMPLPT